MEIQKSKYYMIMCLVLVSSIATNFIFVSYHYFDDRNYLSWSIIAAKEAERVAGISCSGHGRAFLDGIVLDRQNPVCECYGCYFGSDCSQFNQSCFANADGGDPLFLEPFWMKNAAKSAIVVAGWHRMSYTFSDASFISKELEKQIRKLHEIVGNAVTQGRYILFGSGSMQLLNAAVHALSPDNSSSPAKVVASIPFYPAYEEQTEFFQSRNFDFQGDASLWKNNSDPNTEMIEFVTSPNNPDGQLNRAVLQGSNAKAIYDHAYYWPHFTAIPSPANGDIMLFSLSKLTGHAGSRFGWGLIKDEAVYERMVKYMRVNTMGVSRDTQNRAFKLLKVVMEEDGKPIFEFGHETTKKRWETLNKIMSNSNRFSLQKIPNQYCNYFQKVREASPAYGWVKCEREEDKNCYSVLQAANISGRPGNLFYVGDRYVRLTLVRSQDDFDLLIHKLNRLVSKEDGFTSM